MDKNTTMLERLTPEEMARLMIADAHVALTKTIPYTQYFKLSDMIPSLADDRLIVKLAENGARNEKPPRCSRCRYWKLSYIDTGYGSVGDCSQLSSGVYNSPVLVVGVAPDERPNLRTRDSFCCNRFEERANE